ncbi:MAG: hypothetical protein H6739_24685 [Alphaproteobacteria bacterium]|nr:hypothetical protein [Alphaproteobacteria bacterium]
MGVLPDMIKRPAWAFFEWLRTWWFDLTQRQRVHYSVLALLMVGSVAHFLVFAVYYIEDAGISFAYARNFVDGEGWVTFPGGERVEGFSNPLWTWLIALAYAIGIPPWTSSKVMGALFGALCIPLSYFIARRCRPGADDHAALLPPFFLAASSTAAIWHASGLENGLFSVLLAAGMLQVLREAERPERFPWSAVLFLGLALTRPEGILYAAMGGFTRLLLAVRDRRLVGPILRWLVVFWAPFLVYHAWRYNYFAWEWPNTYYAKLSGEDRFQLWKWNTRGWRYLRNYMSAFGFAFILPVFALGLTTLRDWRRWLVVGLTALGAVLYLWDGRAGIPADFDPDWLNWLQRRWDNARVLFTLSAVATVSLATLIRRGGIARLQVVLMTAAGVFFILYSGNDWMAQWRFLSYIVVPGFVLLGLGVAELLACLPVSEERGRLRGVVTAVVLVAVGAPNIWNSAWSAPEPETSVSDVYKRVRYMTWVQRRLHLDRVVLFDVDMGAHMYYSGWRIIDVAGLVDVPMARHSYEKTFIKEYVLNEGRPTFAHMHGGWASKVKIFSHPEFKRDYLEIPGYPAGRRALHVGNHIRRDLFIKDAYSGPPTREHRFTGGVTLEGWDVPAPEVPVEGELYIELWLRAGFRKSDFRVLVVLDDGKGHVHAAALPPGYDWYNPTEWKRSEHIHNRYTFALPGSLPEGRYHLGVVLLDVETGEVLRPLAQPEDPQPARYMDGELFLGEVVKIVSRESATAEADADRQRMVELARSDRCGDAWQAWREARWHIFKNKSYHEEFEPQAMSEVAACYANRAAATDDVQEKVRALTEARWYDHDLDLVTDQARPLAAELDAAGDACAAALDWECAYGNYRDALALDPRLSWTRRKAEQARDLRLGIKGKTPLPEGVTLPPPVKPDKPEPRKPPPIPPREGDDDAGDEGDDADEADASEEAPPPRLGPAGLRPDFRQLKKTPEGLEPTEE